MSIYKRKNSKYYYCEIRINGRVVIRSTRSTRKSLAQQYEHRLREKLYRQQYLGELPELTISQAIDLYERQKRCTTDIHNLNTRIRDIKRQLPKVIPVTTHLSDITPEKVNHLIAIRRNDGVADGSINILLATLRGVISAAKQNGYMVPDFKVPVLKVDNARTRVLSDNEERQLLSILEGKSENTISDSYDLAILLLDTAARLNEIQGLRWSDVDLNRREIHLWRGKTRTETLLKLTDRAYQVLQRRSSVGGASGLVFPSKTGGKRRCAPKALQSAYKKVGLGNFKTHDLRHTAASRLVRRGMSLYEVSQILGHSSVQMSQRYAHLEAHAVADKAVVLLQKR